MSPEYAMYGEFSEKSDVYNFGVLILEIISGKKNSSFESEGAEDLLSYVSMKHIVKFIFHICSIECSKMCENTRPVLHPKLKITAR